MDFSTFGKWLILFGLGVAGLGILVWVLGKSGLLFGSLPGDIRVERPGFSFSFPLVTSIVLSIIITLILNVILWIFRR
ncbi:MAG TPA: DUF2905 domain-containing protein [Desulfomonilaceae bacterium]|nr:DUF2905 domain-containing protein [Desulfomonilaceae bacterium]